MAFTDSQVISSTVASASETSVGTINVPAGRTYTITSVYGGHSSGGQFRINLDTYVSMQGQYLQNQADGNSSSQTGANLYRTNIAAIGPCSLTGYVTNADATTGTASIMINYVDSGPGATN